MEEKIERLKIEVLGYKKCYGCFNPHCTGWNTEPPADFNPYNQWIDTGMLIDRMLELGYFYNSYQAETNGFHNWGFFKKGDFGQTPRHVHPDIKTAICEAALAAVQHYA